MATNKKFNVRHGLSAGTGLTQKDIVSDTGLVYDVGTLSALKTTAKSDTVAAINELHDEIVDVASSTNEPMGVVDRTHSVISFNNTTKTFSIALASGRTEFVVWTAGTKRTYTTTQSVSIGASPATGLYYIFFNQAGVLSYKTTYFDWPVETPIAYVYWNASTAKAEFVADERHGIVLDWQTHEYLHRTRGAVIANGFSISNYTTTGDGSVDAHALFDLGNGTFFDEDLEVNITHSATPTAGTFTQVLTGGAEIPVFYINGSDGAWVRDAATKFACKQSATTLQYNLLSGTTWSTVPATNNRYVVSWIVATNDINAPIITILGQAEYTDIGGAEAVVFGDLALTNFPIFEFRPLWKVIFRTSTGYPNTPNAYIARVLDLRELSSAGSGGSIVSDHGLLTGLADDDHSQYLHTTLTRTGVTAELNTTGKITTTNRIGIGTTTPQYDLHIVGTTDPSGMFFDAYGTVAPNIAGRRANGTTISPTVVNEGDNLLAVTGSGYTGTEFSIARAIMFMKASETWTSTAQGAHIDFITTAPGTTSRSTKLRLDGYGSLLINSLVPTGTASQLLQVTGGGYFSSRVGIGITNPAETLDVVGNIKLTGELRGPASFVIDPAAVGDNTGTVIIKGDLQVDGTTTTINSTTLSIDDKNITIADGVSTLANLDTAGIDFGSTAVRLRYNYNSGTNSGLSIEGTSVGIGTTNPRGRLDVTMVGGSYNSDNLVIGGGNLTYPTSQYSGWGGIVVKGTTSDARMFFQDGNGRINSYWNAYTDTGGYKYIVSNEPAIRNVMSVVGTTGGQWGLYGAPAGTAGGALTWTQTAYIESGASGGTATAWISPRGTSSDFFINSSGNVMLGAAVATGTASQPLQVTGGAYFSGNIGVGVTNPLAQLHVYGPNFPLARIERNTALTTGMRSTFSAIHTTSADMVDGFGADVSFGIRDSAGVDNEIANFGAIRDGADNSGALVFATTRNGTEQGAIKMILKSTGNVGIGTSLPLSKLHVSGGDLLVNSLDGDNVDIKLSVGTDSNSSIIRSTRSSDFQSSLSFHVSDDGFKEAARLNYDGLTVRGLSDGTTAGIAGTIVFSDQSELPLAQIASYKTGIGDNTDLVFGTYDENSFWISEKLRIIANGNVGIGTENPGAKLTVWGPVTIGTNNPIDLGTAQAPFKLVNDNSALGGAGAIINELYSTATSSIPQPGYIARFARGTEASPLAVAAGDRLAYLVGGGYGTTQFHHTAAIDIISEEAYTDSARGSYIRFATTSVGQTARVEKLRITGAGNVGIGTTNPTSKLHVLGSGVFEAPGGFGAPGGDNPANVPLVAKLTNPTGDTFFGALNAYSYPCFALNVSTYTNSSTNRGIVRFYDKTDGNWNNSLVLNTGRVGIGTTNPGSTLAVNGYITESPDNGANYYNVVTQQDIGFNPNQVPLNQYLGQLAFMDEYSPSGLRRAGGGADDLIVDSSGRILIGTATARGSYVFQIEGTTYETSSSRYVRYGDHTVSPGIVLAKARGSTVGSNGLVLANDRLARIEFQGATGTDLTLAALIEGYVDGTASATSMPGRIVFQTVPAGSLIPQERMRISNSGSIGIGTTAPDSNLTIQVDANKRVSVGFGTEATITYRTGTGAWFHAGKSSVGDFFEISNGVTPGTTSNVVVTNTNNVGIGVTNPSAKLQIANTDLADVNYLKVGNLAGPSKYYRYIQIPAKATAAGVADTTKSLYVGRLFTGSTVLSVFTAGDYNEDAFEVLIYKSWGSSSVPIISYHFGNKVSGADGRSFNFHYEAVGNDSYYLYISYGYHNNVPLGTSNSIRLDITSLSSQGSFVVGGTPTIPTLNSSNRLNYGLFVNELGRVAVGNNTNPALAFDGYGSLRMSSGTSFESQIISRNDANDTSGSYFILDKTRAGAAIQNGDPMGTLLWRGMGTAGTIQNSFASIFALAEGTVGAGAIPAGMYLTASSKFVFDLGGEKVRIESSGRVGIGSTAPVSNLEVSTDTTSTSDLTITNSNSGNNITKASRLRFRLTDSVGTRKDVAFITAHTYNLDSSAGNYLSFATRTADAAPTEKMRLDNIGNLGLGTTNPNRQLHIAAAGETNIVFENTSAGTDLKKSRVYHDSSNDFRISFINDAFTNENYILWAKRGATFNISQTLLNPAGGNVGIGTTNATQVLDVNGLAQITANSATLNLVGTDHTYIQWYPDGLAAGRKAYSGFPSAASNSFTIANQIAGGEGHIVFDPGASAAVLIDTTAATGTSSQSLQVNGGAYISGNVGIGATNPTTKLDVAGTAKIGVLASSRSNNGLTVGFTSNNTYTSNTDADDNNRTLSLVNESSTTNAMAILGFRVNPNVANANAMLDLKFVQTGATNTSALHYSFNHAGSFVDRVSILSSGFVGLGITNPGVRLDVGGDASQYGYAIRVRNNVHATSKRASIAFGNGASHQILIDTNGNGTEDFSIYQANINRSPLKIEAATGNIHMGGVYPQAAPTTLSVNGYISESTDGGTNYYNVVTQQDIGFNPNQVPLNQYLGQLAFMDAYSPSGLRKDGGGSDDVVVDSNGRVGIAITNPNGQLTVNSGPQWGAFNYCPNILVQGPRNNGIGILDSSNANPWWIGNGGGALYFAQMPALGNTASAPAIPFSITSTGNVGIGITNPSQRLTNYVNADGGIHTLTQNASTGVSAYAAIHINAGDANAYYFINSQTRTADGGTRTATLRNDGGDIRLQASGTTGIIVKATSGNVGIDTATPAYKLQVNGSFAATTKSFVIDHPTKPDHKLRYGSLEGPENGVYIRGRLRGTDTIELPEYWTELVDEDSITVNLTPIGSDPGVYSIIKIANNTVTVASTSGTIDCFFMVLAERKDVEKLVVEYESEP